LAAAEAPQSEDSHDLKIGWDDTAAQETPAAKDKSHLELTAPHLIVPAAAQGSPLIQAGGVTEKESFAMKLRYMMLGVLFTLLIAASTAFGTVYFLRYAMQLSDSQRDPTVGPARRRVADKTSVRAQGKEQLQHDAQDDDDSGEEPATSGASVPPGMVSIPAGNFRMGSRDGYRDERPEHVETVRAFWLDQREVSVAEFGKCVAIGECRGQRTTHQVAGDRKFNRFCNYGRSSRGQHPMNCVDWYQARAYCRWAGKRLPTEVEWEYAARGTDNRMYPWGNEGPSERQLNACGQECAILGTQIGKEWNTMYAADDGWDATAPVGSFPRDRSPFGVLDMAGNVAEWTDTDYVRCYRDDCEPTGHERVFRGGSWNDDDARDIRGAYRNHDEPVFRGSFVGFRCAKTRASDAATP
jgi:formylglycine-generating enzyme required for sulfatase activity